MSKASLLPEEALLQIFRYFDDVPLPDDAECQWNTHWLAKCALVCKSWTHPARCSLYEDLYIPEAGQLALLYESIKYLRPDNGNLVRAFDTRGALRENGPDRIVGRLVAAMPNLETLSLRLIDAKALKDAACFRSLRHLSLYTRATSPDQVDEKTVVPDLLPKTLQSLKLSADRLHLDQGMGPEATYPHLRSLAITSSLLSFPHPPGRPRTPQDRLLPIMPSLTNLTLNDCCFEDGAASDTLSAKIVSELSPTLESLRLQGPYRGNRLDKSCLGGLRKLKTLEYFFRANISDIEMLRDIPPMDWEDVPPQIQSFALRWEGRSDFGRGLLQRLQDPQFLPNLTTCPHITLLNPFLSHTDDELHQLMAEVTHERDLAAQSLADRPNRINCWQPGFGDRHMRQYTILPVVLPR